MASVDVITALANVQTIGQARASLGVLTGFLQSGYDLLANVTTSQGLHAATQGDLDVVNTYLQQIYSSLPSDDASQALDLDFSNAARLGLAASQTEDALDQVTDSANVSRFDIGSALADAIASSAQQLGQAAAAAGKNLGAGLTAGFTAFWGGAWPYLAVGAAVLVAWKFRAAVAKAIA